MNWEIIHYNEKEHSRTSRMKVPGGWLVLYQSWLNNHALDSMCYVPDITFTWGPAKDMDTYSGPKYW